MTTHKRGASVLLASHAVKIRSPQINERDARSTLHKVEQASRLLLPMQRADRRPPMSGPDRALRDRGTLALRFPNFGTIQPPASSHWKKSKHFSDNHE